jgi:hypothetical protein
MGIVTSTITINMIEYQQLVSALEACGVDNWSGYPDAMEMMETDMFEKDEE